MDRSDIVLEKYRLALLLLDVYDPSQSPVE